MVSFTRSSPESLIQTGSAPTVGPRKKANATRGKEATEPAGKFPLRAAKASADVTHKPTEEAETYRVLQQRYVTCEVDGS